jgi:hypothetical protein
LRRFRSKVFHPADFNDESIVIVLKDHGRVRDWASALTGEMRRYLFAYADTI